MTRLARDDLVAIKNANPERAAQVNRVAPFDRKPLLKDPQETILKGYIHFIQNCQKRQAMERQLRKERGLQPNTPVWIPSPGVKSLEDWDFGDRKVPVPYYAINGHKVWGATAVMLSELEGRLRAVIPVES